MNHICDKCMSAMVRKGAPPHIAFYGHNSARWVRVVCDVCGEVAECVYRPDLELNKE